MRGSWCLHWQTISRCRKMEDGLQGGRGGGSRPGRSSVGAVQCWMNSVSRSSPLIIYIQLSHCGYKSLVLNFTCGYKNTFTCFAVYSLKNKTRCTLNWIFFFLFLLTHSYLPIIVECCWTAASNSRSSMVHSPMIAHSERKTSRGSCYSLSASPRAPQISSDCISACVCVCVLSPAVRSRPSVLQALIGGQPSWAPVRGGRAVCLSAVWSTVCRSALIPL